MSQQALELFINSIQTQSSNGNYEQMAETGRRAVRETLPKNLSNLDNLLATLDLQQHSIGVLAILVVKLNAVNSQNAFEGVFAQITEFLSSCNSEQIRHCPDLYGDLCRKLAEWLVRHNEAVRGIELMSKAVRRFQTSPGQLTSMAADLFLLCLHARTLKPALPFLDEDVTDIAKEVSPKSLLKSKSASRTFDSRHFLLYFYYGGMIYAALKKFERALLFFEVAVTTPCTAVSQIMVESYKKFILIGLIYRGKVPSLPKYTSSVVNRFIKPMCTHYTELSSLYGSGRSPTALNDHLTRNQETFSHDQNTGLVKQVITSLYKRNILRLTKTFVTLSLSDVANRCSLASPEVAEKYILGMIEDGEIYATIDQKDGMVYFHDNPEKYSSLDVMEGIENELKSCMNLEGMIKKLDTEILLNPQYVHRVSKGSNAGAGTFPQSLFHDDEGVSVGSGLLGKDVDMIGM